MSDTYNFGHAGCRMDCSVCADRWNDEEPTDEEREFNDAMAEDIAIMNAQRVNG